MCCGWVALLSLAVGASIHCRTVEVAFSCSSPRGVLSNLALSSHGLPQIPRTGLHAGDLVKEDVGFPPLPLHR